MSKYQNAKVYKIVSPHTDKCYVGSTCKKLKYRLSDHITDFKRDSTVTSKHILKFGDYEIVLIENHACETKAELETRERFYIESLNSVNKVIPGRSREEWYQDNPGYNKRYQQDNATAIKEYNKQRYQDNIEAIKQKKKQYRLDNATAINERQKKKYNCNCGGKFTRVHTLRHQKSKKHIKYLESIN